MNLTKLKHKILKTKTGRLFKIKDVSDSHIYIELPSGIQSINISNLKKAIKILQNNNLYGPKDYKNLVADERPAYAWAILKELKYLK